MYTNSAYRLHSVLEGMLGDDKHKREEELSVCPQFLHELLRQGTFEDR
jgi:hypothetical protein